MSDRSHVRFSQHTLANGLRLIIAPDRVAPVVAINLWYDVGSKHEQPGKTGFAHLFEHFMFQGSRHVAKAEHLAIVQGAGGMLNATTYFDRTNYFETLPSHEVELGLWLEADRMATLLDAMSQENLDNQRDVVKNEKRQSYDNRPYGSFYEKLMAAVFPVGHPYHHTPIGSMEDLDAAGLDDVEAFFRTYYVPNNAVLTVAGDVDEAPVIEAVERYFGPIAPNDCPAALPPAGHPADGGHAGGRARRRAAGAGARGLPLPGLRDARVRCSRSGHADPRGRARQPAAQAPGARGAGRPGRGPVRPAPGGRRVHRRRLGHGAARLRCRARGEPPRRGAAAHGARGGQRR